MSEWMAEEARYERRRNRGWFRKDQPLPYDPTLHEPAPEDRRVEKPLDLDPPVKET